MNLKQVEVYVAKDRGTKLHGKYRKFYAAKEKGRRKAPSSRMLRGNKRTEKILRDTKQAHGNKSSRADHAHMKKINFTRQK